MTDRYVDPEDGNILARFDEAIADHGDRDPETEHKVADAFVADALEAAGFKRTAERYRGMCDNRFWYS